MDEPIVLTLSSSDIRTLSWALSVAENEGRLDLDNPETLALWDRIHALDAMC